MGFPLMTLIYAFAFTFVLFMDIFELYYDVKNVKSSDYENLG